MTIRQVVATVSRRQAVCPLLSAVYPGTIDLECISQVDLGDEPRCAHRATSPLAELTRILASHQYPRLPRTAASLIVVYPPGIAIMVPGERSAEDSAAVAYLKLLEDGDKLFPGFESEIQGIFPRRDADGRLRYYTYVVTKH